MKIKRVVEGSELEPLSGTSWPLDSPLGSVREHLRESISEGTTCPACSQTVKTYRWTLYSSAAYCLGLFYHLGGTEEYTHMRDLRKAPTNSPAHLAHWGLVAPEPNRTGRWCVTTEGEAFLLRQLRVRKHAHVYNGRVLRMSGGWISIDDALGKKFSYTEMLNTPG